MTTRTKQLLLVAAGAAVALVMCLLGLWQMQVFVDKGNRTVEARAEQPPVALLDHVNADGTVGDVYGKRVTVSGRYLPDQQLLVVAEDGTVRVLTAFEVSDGRVVPIVRGATSERAAITAAPTAPLTETGLFLPGEGDAARQTAAGELGTVRMPLVAQAWPQRITPGYVTLDAEGSARHGLAEASVSLPRGDGSIQNGGYALQWWVFAAFALGMSIKFAHSLGERDRRTREEAALAQLSASDGEES